MPRNINQLLQFIEQDVTGCSVLVVGDVMLDRYYYGEVKRISPEAPVPVTRVRSQKETMGGAANVAHNLARLGCRTFLAGVVGQDDNRNILSGLLDDRGIVQDGLIVKEGPTTTKLRVIGGHQQMIRLDFEEAAPVNQAQEDQLKEYIGQALTAENIGSVIISDYAKGVCTPALCRYSIDQCNEKGIPIVIDPKGTDWQKYKGVPYITPNLKELQEAANTGIPNSDEDVKRIAQLIKRRYQIKNIVVTRSEKGLSLVGAKRCVHIPTHAQEVFDVSGAGDTVIAVLAAALAAGLDAADAAYLANLAAGIVVGKVGTYAISRQELLDALQLSC